MASNNSEINNLFSASNLKNLSDDDDYDINFEKKSKIKLILFFIFSIFMIIILMIIIILLIYFLIIKPEKLKSNRVQNPETYLNLKKRANIRDFIDLCMKGILLDEKKYPKIDNPKISIIIPVYNKEQFILRILRSIQNQSFKDIEIIFCDDNSKDNSTILIEKYQKEDERIVLLKHEKNKGTLVCRVDGINISKGEYILFIDADDFLVNNILANIYAKAKNNNIDLLQFQAYVGDYKNTLYLSHWERSTKPIYQPKLSEMLYYEKGYLSKEDIYIWGKLIKREVLKEVLNSIDKYYLNQHMLFCEDGMLIFFLYKKANSYLFTKDYGMIYYSNPFSTMANSKNKEKINDSVRDCFIYLEFMFNYTNNTLHEKNIAIEGFGDIYVKITSGFDYIYKVIDLYLNCDIISAKDKQIIKKVKKDIKEREQNISL